jgi:hypothetical protein
MKRLRTLIALLAVGSALLTTFPARAYNQKSAQLAYKFLQNTSTFTYCVLNGQGGSPFGAEIPGSLSIKTTGSTVTTDERDAGSGPFSVVAVNDFIMTKGLTAPFTVAPRNVVTHPSNAQITVDTAWNLGTGQPFWYKNSVCGITAADGWVDVSGLTVKQVAFTLNTLGGTSVDIRLECQAPVLGANPVKIWPPTGTTDPTSCGSGAYNAGNCRYSAVTTGPTVGTDLYSVPRDAACGKIRLGVATNGGSANYTAGVYEVLDTQN